MKGLRINSRQKIGAHSEMNLRKEVALTETHEAE